MGPDGTFSNSLASTFSAPVPADTPPKDQTKNPPPGVGPYVIAKSDPEREFAPRRRENFSLPGSPSPGWTRSPSKSSTSRAARPSR